ncbi:hypothetical protein [Pandoraea cepalis]|uniref:hypothetical protein n=1 Tax=Pandoraea cepalis TaxID=2508294 RepID=UPI0012408077|nr:hypothetical protein [Pandoraea cepalis]
MEKAGHGPLVHSVGNVPRHRYRRSAVCGWGPVDHADMPPPRGRPEQNKAIRNRIRTMPLYVRRAKKTRAKNAQLVDKKALYSCISACYFSHTRELIE